MMPGRFSVAVMCQMLSPTSAANSSAVITSPEVSHLGGYCAFFSCPSPITDPLASTWPFSGSISSA